MITRQDLLNAVEKGKKEVEKITKRKIDAYKIKKEWKEKTAKKLMADFIKSANIIIDDLPNKIIEAITSGSIYVTTYISLYTEFSELKNLEHEEVEKILIKTYEELQLKWFLDEENSIDENGFSVIQKKLNIMIPEE